MSPAAWLTPERWPWVAGVFAAAMLAAAHSFQAAGYAPCTLCLRQREVYWALLAVVGLWAAAGVVRRAVRSSRLPVLLVAAVFLLSAGVATYHAGAEWRWWPGPSACASGGGGGLDAGDLAAVLSGAKPVRPPACDEAPWVFAGLSMAGWNAALSFGMAAVSLAVAVRSRRRVQSR
jgi:disulfide bond formation protein DsbB